MPRIVRFHEVGGPEVLNIEDVPSKQPSKDEVALSVQAIGLNRAESMFMHGYYVEPTQLPATLGYEASGIAGVTQVDPSNYSRQSTASSRVSMTCSSINRSARNSDTSILPGGIRGIGLLEHHAE